MAKNSSHTIAMHLFVYCLLVLCSLPTRAQQVITNLSADSLSKYPKGKPLQRLQWLYQSGDNQNWKKVTTKEQHWEKVHTNFGSNKPLANWNGMGWFRLWFKADSSLRNQMLALRINHDGASEIYLDGEKIGGYGKVASTKQHMVASRAAFHVIPFKINDHKPHLIAVRYSNHFNYFPEFIGFETWIGSFDQLSAAASTSMQRNDFLLISAGAQLALALLHIFLFAFYPKQKLNLYYSLFVLLSASTIAIPFIISDTTDPAIQAVANNVFAVAITLSTLAIGLLFYAISFPVLPKWRILIMSLMALGLLSYIVIVSQACECAVTDQMGNFFNMYYLLVNLDGVRAIIIAIRRKKPGVWLIGLGMFILSLFFFFVGADVFGWITSAELKNQLMSFGLLVMPLCFSLYLALDFARTNRNLSTKLLQVQQLSELNLAQEAEKLKLITEQAQQLEQTVTERTLKVQSQADKLREMDAVKSRFMINLTHEFRTPLTLILGPAKQILAEKRDPRTIMQASTIYRNADRLLQLINQMLDLSKLEAGKMELTNTSTELVGLVRRALLSFESLAIEKRIALQLDSYWDELWLWLDQDKFEKILVNLLSNSMKFT